MSVFMDDTNSGAQVGFRIAFDTVKCGIFGKFFEYGTVTEVGDGYVCYTTDRGIKVTRSMEQADKMTFRAPPPPVPECPLECCGYTPSCHSW